LEIWEKSPASDVKKIVFSGDLGNSPEDLLQETELLDNAEAVVMESTYGDKLHENGTARSALLAEIQAVESNNGTLLIPAFSMDRTQEVLHLLMQLKKERRIRRDTPVFVDSPMALLATKVYNKHQELFNSRIKTDFSNGNPIEFEGLVMVDNPHHSKSIQQHTGSCVIVAGSGMMTGGRILSHAAHYLPIASTRLFIVGYQGEGTLGRELLSGARSVIIGDREIQVNAQVASTGTMSSHADQKQLLKVYLQI
jgi:metallo-beta-lactamase family protein